MTPQQQRIRAAISGWTAGHKYAPTVRELGDLLGLRSSATIHHHLRAMRQAGLVDWVDGQVRTLHVMDIEGLR